VSHVGSLKSGHYSAYIRTNQQPTRLHEEFLTKAWVDPKSVREKIETFLKENHVQNQQKTATREQIEEDTWYRISDTYVCQCQEQEVVDDSHASILFYERMA